MSIRPTEAIVDLAAVVGNYRLAVELSGCPAMGVVKANAYGHGAVPVARALTEAGCTMLAVALVEEGIELREAGCQSSILVVGGAYGDRYDLLVSHGLTPLVFSVAQVRALAAAARAASVRATVHLKLDTGMGRIGALPTELPALLEALRQAPELELEGVCTHFASADLEPRAVTERQVTDFHEALLLVERAGLRPRLRHLANSAGTLEYPAARQDITRPGIMLYGYLPFGESEVPSTVVRRASELLRPALSWRTAITHVKTVPPGTPISYGGHWRSRRQARIATIPVGYADGYSRQFSGRPGFGCADVLVRGKRAPVAGTVCMDMSMVDVTDVPDAAVGDEVVLLGRQGNEQIDAVELAAKAGTISYEVLCGIGARVPRRYR